MKSATSLSPPSTGFRNTKCIGVIDPKGPEKQHRDEVGATFYGRHTAPDNRCYDQGPQ